MSTISSTMTSERFLLDTNVVLLALRDPASLSPRARKAILAGPNVLSTVVYWEVVLKVMKGTLTVGHPRAWWLDALDMLAATALPVGPKHVDLLHDLPSIHKDPFDRMLIAQASADGCTLVTTDREIPKYKTKHIRVIC
jgi:PIN domain nuclease of toxin-antitoxin system